MLDTPLASGPVKQVDDTPVTGLTGPVLLPDRQTATGVRSADGVAAPKNGPSELISVELN